MASHVVFFFFNDTATTEIYTLSLHDALPISDIFWVDAKTKLLVKGVDTSEGQTVTGRSEEHRSELQSHLNLVCRLLLEKKKKNIKLQTNKKKKKKKKKKNAKYSH